MRPKGSWLGRRFRVLPRRYWLPAMFAGILTSHALFVLSFKYRNADRIDQAREALGAKALTQSQLIEEVEKELDRMAEQRSKKE